MIDYCNLFNKLENLKVKGILLLLLFSESPNDTTNSLYYIYFVNRITDRTSLMSYSSLVV